MCETVESNPGPQPASGGAFQAMPDGSEKVQLNFQLKKIFILPFEKPAVNYYREQIIDIFTRILKIDFDEVQRYKEEGGYALDFAEEQFKETQQNALDALKRADLFYKNYI